MPFVVSALQILFVERRQTKKVESVNENLKTERDEEIAKCAIKEETLAAGEYAAHLAKATGRKLRKVPKENQNDELAEHVGKLKEYLLSEEAKEQKKRKKV